MSRNPIQRSEWWGPHDVPYTDYNGRLTSYRAYMNHHFLRNQFFAQVLAPELGTEYKGDRWPKEASGRVSVEGWTFVLKPSEFAGTGYRRAGLKHRLYIECTCGREVPVGRVAQHRCDGPDNDPTCETCGGKVLSTKEWEEYEEAISADRSIGPVGDFDYYEGLCTGHVDDHDFDTVMDAIGRQS